MKLSIGETARITGVSVRTLHYYDEIGLLTPSEVSETGYRFYDDRALERLQQILFLRELDFPLKEIGAILSRPDFDRKEALIKHRELLLLKQRHIGDLIRLVDETLGGNSEMNQKNLTYDDYTQARESYAEEARQRWGHTEAYAESEKRSTARSKAEALAAMNEAEEIFAAFAAVRHLPPEGPEAQSLVRRWQAHITAHYYDCTGDILAGLGEMYVADDRFAANLDNHGAGTARFLSDAIREYCGK